jgi:hypothetical protein
VVLLHFLAPTRFLVKRISILRGPVVIHLKMYHEFQWRNPRPPRIDGSRWRLVNFGDELRHNHGIARFRTANGEYGWFFSNHCSNRYHQGTAHPLEELEDEGLATYYHTSLNYDEGDDTFFFQVHFFLLDSRTRILYASQIFGRPGSSGRIVVNRDANDDNTSDSSSDSSDDENLYSFEYYENNTMIRTYNVFAEKLTAAMRCREEVEESQS